MGGLRSINACLLLGADSHTAVWNSFAGETEDREECNLRCRAGNGSTAERKNNRSQPQKSFTTVRLVKFLPTPSSAAATAAAATITTAISATASAVASTAPSVFGLRTGFVHVEGSSAHLRSVQRGDGFFSILVAGHLHKAEAARAPGIAVGHDADPVHLPERLKHLPQFVFRCVKAQISDKNILHASASALSCRSASSMRQTGRSGTPSWKSRPELANSRMRHEV